MSRRLGCVNMDLTRQEYTCFCMYRRKKEGESMCRIISEIQGKSADDLLRMSDQASSFPIDLEKLLETLKISCEPVDFEKMGDSKGEILGALAINGDKAVIFYRDQDAKDSHRSRFTIAHEIAHACLSNKQFPSVSVHFRRDGDAEDTEELAANIFAGELLVPERMLNVVIGKLLRPSVKGLSNIFDVSERVVIARLKHLRVKDEILGYNC